MVKNKNIIDKLMMKYKKNENLFFGEKFDEYIKNYDINKHNINTNTKVLMLIAKKANQEFKKLFDSYIEMALDERFYNITYDEYEHIKRNAELNVQIKWSIFMDHHEQYKLINMIKKKYGFPPQEKYIINYIKNEDASNEDEFSLEEIRKRTTFGDNGVIYFNKCED
jgi:hypothetical protein